MTGPLGNISTHDVVLCIYKYILYVCAHTNIIVYVHIYIYYKDLAFMILKAEHCVPGDLTFY